MKEYNRVVARIDLDAIEWNMDHLKGLVAEKTNFINVLKADGYGHGSVPIAQLMNEKDYIWGFCVATLDEAMILRNAGIEKPILVLGCVFPDQYETLINNRISMTVYDKELLKPAVELAKKLKKDLFVHIKIDTGMGRLGFFVNDENVKIIKEISEMEYVVMEGLFTHFSKADERDKTYTYEQIKAFSKMKEALEKEGVTFSYYHTSNSAGILEFKEANFDLVRTGISCFGLYPSTEVDEKKVALKPALSLVSQVVSLKSFDPGKAISYGGTFITKKKTLVATVPVGYADGYARSLSNKAYVLIRGQKAPILGRICMDQFMVDVTDIKDVSIYDKVTLIGYDKDEQIPVELLSDISGRFNYEFVCDISKRVPREYIRNGETITQQDYF
ncbi:MAG TPA: alanine racemase [Candidatus Dorea intestinavium]|nr:alanine racemase [Candidatus Dorea intestinavium]